MLFRARPWIVCLALLALSASPAAALGTLDNFLTITQEGVGSMTLSGSMLGCQMDESGGAEPIGFSCDGSGQTFVPGNPAFDWEISDWSAAGLFDPMLNIGFGFTNTGPTTTFTITSIIPVAPLGPATVMGGSTGGSVTDNGDGVGGLGTAGPDPFFVGLIDGVAQATTALHPDVTNLPGPGFPGTFLFGGQTVNIPAVYTGLPGPTIVGPAAVATIGIRHRFQLAAGDSVAVTSFFEVQVIPEPGTAALLVFGLAGLALRRRAV